VTRQERMRLRKLGKAKRRENRKFKAAVSRSIPIGHEHFRPHPRPPMRFIPAAAWALGLLLAMAFTGLMVTRCN
jgi:hypothetical protein